MELIYAAAFVSFVLGATSYIIIRFWVLPIYRYRKRKRSVAATLSRYQKVRERDASGSSDDMTVEDLSATLRKQAAELSDSFDLEVPHWYRMLLNSRGESPVDAARLLMKLANTQNIGHIEKQIGRIVEVLRL